MGQKNITRITAEMFRKGEIDRRLLSGLLCEKCDKNIEISGENIIIRCLPVSDDGKEYELLFNRLKRKEEYSEVVDLSFTYIEEGDREVLKELLKEKPNLKATYSFFDGEFDFSGMTFENLEMPFSIFKGNVNFGRMTLKGDTDFEGSVFEGDADFEWSVFEGDADFEWSVFEGKTEFKGSVFKGIANFAGTAFNESVVFGTATFEKDAYFRFSTFEKDADLGDSEFGGDADFIKTTFIIIFDSH